jgi:galactokinase
VNLAIAAFREGDRSAVGEIAAASQGDADRWLDNQVPETRRLASLALEHGAFASSSFGAGFGGSVWALAERAAAVDVATGWRRAYLGGGAADGDVESFITRPSPGALELFEASEHVE